MQVGQGGGPPHLHGDPFGNGTGASCLYGPQNYTSVDGTTSVDAHPPIIGFSFDGHLIYGRHLSTDAPGYQKPKLDACGGHSHDEDSYDIYNFSLADYHYHTQVFDALVDNFGMAKENENYSATTTGAFQCFKADLTASPGSSALLGATASSKYADQREMGNRCCGMSDYYLLTGVEMPDNNNDVDPSSRCSAPSPPNGGSYNGTVCQDKGAVLYSGWVCDLTCNNGLTPTGTTQCIKGSLGTTATCEKQK